jgi:hypothetical protein
MKKRSNVIVLVIEIAAIIILHAVKLSQSDKESQYKNSITSQYSVLKQAAQVRPPFIFIKMAK